MESTPPPTSSKPSAASSAPDRRACHMPHATCHTHMPHHGTCHMPPLARTSRMHAHMPDRTSTPAQTRDVVLHRIVAVGPKGQHTIEQRIVERNTSQEVTRQAVNT